MEDEARQHGPHNSIFFSSRFSGRKKRKIDLLAAYRGGATALGHRWKEQATPSKSKRKLKFSFSLLIGLLLLRSLSFLPPIDLLISLCSSTINGASSLTQSSILPSSFNLFINSKIDCLRKE